ncbi:MAG: MiaB/RimO family radical SAM methylthiotransferase [Exilispira sp.]
MKSFYLLTLGCSKNEVISQKFIESLLKKGLIKSDIPDQADYIIINSCGFIEDALKETIEEVIKHSKFKMKNSKIILTGCAANLYKDLFEKELYEADIVLNYDQFYKFFDIESYEKTIKRKIENKKWEYLLISEGCNKNCTFCTIPLIKGNYRSFELNQLTSEVNILKNAGVEEIILISQDTAYYGMDLYKNTFKNPLKKLLELIHNNGIEKIRILYFNLDSILSIDKFEYIKDIYSNDFVIPYFEIPVQNLVDNTLKRMGRSIDYKNIELIFSKIKKNFNNSVIRTSIITGFPGETDEDYLLLKQRLMNLPVDYLNVFAYSDMEKAPSYKMKDKVDPKVAIERRNDLLETFENSLKKRFERFIGFEDYIYIEDEDKDFYIGRASFQTPDLDGLTYIYKDKKSKKIIGKNYNKKIKIKIIDSFFYDFYGETI